MARSHSIVAAAALCFAACSPSIEQPDPSDLQAARQAALGFDARMLREITDRIDRDEDPVAVYLAYADHVPGWAKEVSDRNKFDFSRTSLAPRNPASSPDNWEQGQMEMFNFMADTGLDPSTLETAQIVQEGDEKVFRWMRPILMTEPCLACHGAKLEPRISLLLAQEYPLDSATGYFEGQIGGAYTVRKVLSVKGKTPPPYVPVPLPPQLPAEERKPGDAPLVQPEPAPSDPPPPSEEPT